MEFKQQKKDLFCRKHIMRLERLGFILDSNYSSVVKENYSAVCYCKSTLTSSAEKIALASEETKKEKGVGLGMKNLKIQQSIPPALRKYLAVCGSVLWAGTALSP